MTVHLLTGVNRTVGDAMVTTPVTHPPETTLAEAVASLDNPHRHLLLIVDDGRLLGTVEREDLGGVAGADALALTVARDGRTARADDELGPVWAAMTAAGERRRAVVDDDGTLLGLLCLKRSGTGFCTDEGVRSRSAARAGQPGVRCG